MATATSDTYAYSPPKPIGEHAAPLGGLALPLAESVRSGIPADLSAAALRKVLVPPSINHGIDFSEPEDSGPPRRLEGLLDPVGYPRFMEEKLRQLKSRGRLRASQLAPLLPLLNLPATDTWWVYEGHFTRLIEVLWLGFVSISGVVERHNSPHPLRRPLPHVFPTAKGPVRKAHLRKFFLDFPEGLEMLARSLPFAGNSSQSSIPAAEANEAVTKMLGFEVDVRIGSLISENSVDGAIDLAGGDAVDTDGFTQCDRLTEFVDVLVPAVRHRSGFHLPRARGAVWSCMLDAVLNSDLVWTRKGLEKKEGDGYAYREHIWLADLQEVLPAKHCRVRFDATSIRDMLRRGNRSDAC